MKQKVIKVLVQHKSTAMPLGQIHRIENLKN
jgi:hypothetical protein